MRRLAAALVLLAVSGTSARGQAPYSVRWGDAASVVAAGVVALIPEATKLPKSGPSCGSTAPCDPASLPGIDRSALHTFSGSASTTSTVLLAGDRVRGAHVVRRRHCGATPRARCGVRQLARLDAGRHRLGEGAGAPQATGAVYLRRNGGGRRPQQPALVPVRTRFDRIRCGDELSRDGSA